MLSSGRRRLSPLRLLIPFLVLLILSSTVSAASAVLGIDLGTEYIKAALVKPGTPLEIVLTKDSRRKEAATLAFKTTSSASSSENDIFPERLYGADAAALSARFPGDVFPNLKQLLGLNYDHAVATEYRNRYPGLAMEDVQNKIGFRSQCFENKEDPFTVEELLAMEFQNILANADAAAGKGYRVTDAVITVPAFFTAAEKHAVEWAADLAGINVLGLISDGLAVGLNYATSRTFPSVSEGGKPEYHLIYDMGAGSTTATVLRFQGKTVKDVGKFNKSVQEVQVVGVAWDETLGGDAWNSLIVDNMVEKFVARPRMKEMGVLPIHVKKHGKTMARLWKDAERMRQVLSANQETSASFEGLFYDDMNFQYKLSRTEFEKLAGEYSGRVTAPLTGALESAQLSLSDLESVILHGGAVRTPFAQKELESVAGASKIRTNVNADEAAALGAAFKAAGISPSFRVKDIRAYDAPGYAVYYKSSADGKERQQKLFTPTSQVGAEKQVSIKTSDDIKLVFSQLVDGEDVPVVEVQTTNLTSSVAQLKDKHGCDASNITAKFTIRLSPVNGLPELVQSTVSCETTTPEKGSMMDGVKGLFGFGSKKDEQQPLNDEENPLEDSSGEQSASSSSEEPSSTTTPSAQASTTAQDSKPRTIVIPVRFSRTPVGRSAPANAGTVSRVQKRLAAFDKSDRTRKLHSEALNTLESFTYRARDYLSDEEFISFSSDAIRQTLEEKLNDLSEWLYGDGLNASLGDLKSKLADLHTLVDPVLKRRDEASKREEAIEKLKQQLNNTNSMLRVMKEQIEKSASESLASASLTRTPETPSPFTTTGPSSSVDIDDDDLDSDPYSTTTSTSTVPPSASPSSLISPYTETDLTSLSAIYDTVSTWLTEKLSAQSKLNPTEDPAMLVADLETRAKQLGDEIQALVRRKIQIPPRSSSSSAKNSKSKKKSSSSSAKKSSSTPTTTSSVPPEYPPDLDDDNMIINNDGAAGDRGEDVPPSTEKEDKAKGPRKGKDEL